MKLRKLMQFSHVTADYQFCWKPADVGDTSEFSAGLLKPQHPVPSIIKGRIERRYAVYRNNVTVGLVRALEANFPVVRKLLGEQYFAGFARDFAQTHPPQSPLMFHYGEAFPKTLESDRDLSRYPYLGDVARLEILWRESFHAADAAVLAANVLSAIDPDVLFSSHFIVHPAARLMKSPFAIHSIFVANKSDNGDQYFDPTQAQSVLVTRPYYEIAVHAITPEQFTFFLALMNGENLGDALDRAAEINTDFDLSNTLALLLQSGAFQSIQTNNGQTL
jgi:Putative DNA-binding domain